jgi:hypothetical protein
VKALTSWTIPLLVALIVAGCGAGSPTTATSSGFGREVRSAMAATGDFVTGHALLKQSGRLLPAVRAELEACELERALPECERKKYVRVGLAKGTADLRASEALLKLFNVKLYSKRALQEAQSRIEAKGLIGSGCHERSDHSWDCGVPPRT